jgi:hypothetical protein
MEDRWFTPLKKIKPKRPLENNSLIMFERRLVDGEVDEDEASGVAPVDPLDLFRNRDWYQPPRPMTPVSFQSIEPEEEDLADHAPKIIHEIITGPHKVRLTSGRMLRSKEFPKSSAAAQASPELGTE